MLNSVRGCKHASAPPFPSGFRFIHALGGNGVTSDSVVCAKTSVFVGVYRKWIALFLRPRYFAFFNRFRVTKSEE